MNRLVILLGLGVAAIGGGVIFALSQKSQVSAQSAPALIASPVRSQPTAIFPIPSVAVASSAQSLKISTCHGSPAHANFRQSPSFSPGSILGVVEIGESLNLTGRTIQVQGEVWHEVVNPAPLHPTPDRGAKGRTGANQLGWIAGCFVRVQ